MPKIEILSLDTDNRLDELTAFNTAMHSPPPEFFGRFFLRNPASNKPEYHRFLTVDGKIVAGTSLTRHTLQWYGGRISAGEIGLVGTLESERKKGYSKRLLESWFETMRDDGIPLSFLWGIPGFYEKYHYYYAYPHLRTAYVSFEKSRTEKFAATGTIRKAEISDRWWIQKLYRAYNAGVNGCQIRDEDQWNWYFTLTDGTHSKMTHAWWVTEDPTGGYALVSEGPSENVLIVREITAPSSGSLKNLVMGLFDAYPEITCLDFFHHPDLPVGLWLKEWGAEIRSVEDIWHGTWAGMVRLMDVAPLMMGMKDKLSERLSRSNFYNITETIPIHSEIGSAVIIVKNGSVDVEKSDTHDGIFIPAYALTPMMTGYKSFARFRSNSGDLKNIPDRIADILDILFQRDIVYMYDMLYIDEWLS